MAKGDFVRCYSDEKNVRGYDLSPRNATGDLTRATKLLALRTVKAVAPLLMAARTAIDFMAILMVDSFFERYFDSCRCTETMRSWLVHAGSRMGYSWNSSDAD